MKNVLMFLGLFFELMVELWILIIAEVNGRHDEKLSKDNSTRAAIEAEYPNCYIHSIIQEIYFSPQPYFCIISKSWQLSFYSFYYQYSLAISLLDT